MQKKTRITIGVAGAAALALTAIGGVAIAQNKAGTAASEAATSGAVVELAERGGKRHSRSWRDGKHKAYGGKHHRRHKRGHGMRRAFKLLDTNGDGKVSMAEIAAEQKRLLAAADVDGNGTLSADEFRRRGRLIMSLRTWTFFDMMDADGNGELSAAELNGPAGRWLKRKDGDKSGDLTREEIRPKWAEKMKKKREMREEKKKEE